MVLWSDAASGRICLPTCGSVSRAKGESLYWSFLTDTSKIVLEVTKCRQRNIFINAAIQSWKSRDRGALPWISSSSTAMRRLNRVRTENKILTSFSGVLNAGDSSRLKDFFPASRPKGKKKSASPAISRPEDSREKGGRSSLNNLSAV